MVIGMPKTIHICIVTTAHPVDDVRVNHKFARSFLNAGFRVSWVGPSHAFFDLKKCNLNNIEFFLTPPIRNRADRLLSHRKIQIIAEGVSKVDVYYAPDPDAAQIAISLAKKNSAKVIFDIHEIYHGTLLDRWLFGFRLDFIREFMRKWIERIASKCDLVIGVSESVLASYITNKVESMVVRSCAPSWFCTNKTNDIHGEQRTAFTVIHGKSDFGRGTLQAVEAAALCLKQVGDLRIVMFESVKNMKNDTTHPLISRIKELGMNEVIDIRPSIPMQDMPGVLQRCDAGLILYNRALGRDSLPNRIFEYMASGLAIIAPIYAREIVPIIRSEQCGLLVDCEDPAEIAKAIVQLSSNLKLCYEMGRRSQDAFLARHNWETEIRPVIACIQNWQISNLK